MSAEVQKQKLEPVKEANGVTSLRFIESVPFAGTEQTHARIAMGQADSITPCCLMADGSFSRDANRPANGVLLERKLKDSHGRVTGIERVFVFASNTRGLAY